MQITECTSEEISKIMLPAQKTMITDANVENTGIYNGLRQTRKMLRPLQPFDGDYESKKLVKLLRKNANDSPGWYECHSLIGTNCSPYRTFAYCIMSLAGSAIIRISNNAASVAGAYLERSCKFFSLNYWKSH
uniref:Uncharacterized protein n=1 Tax=Romanomermis culicivorax TaxID=13658 RepID=A0A915I0G5_ROMCU